MKYKKSVGYYYREGKKDFKTGDDHAGFLMTTVAGKNV